MGNQREKRRFSLINNMIFLSCKQKFCLSLGLESNFPIIQLFIFLHHHGDSQSQSSISVAVFGLRHFAGNNRETLQYTINSN